MSTSSRPSQTLRFGIFELDARAGELRKRGMKLRLQGQPLQVLAVLLRRPGELVTREEIRDELWPADTFVDFDHALHNAIARIREALGDSAEAPRYVETLPRRGYRFIGRIDPPREQPSTVQQIRAIAVLPLEEHSDDSGHEYFADGMTEALITSIAKIKALRVISRTSAMQYKGARKPLPQIARELNVDALIEGSVLRAGDRVRIAAQLIHAATDQHLWAESYERDLRDVLAVQSEIACRIAHEVSIVLTPEELARLNTSRQVHPKAHELYLKARYHWNKRSEEGVKKAISLFREAIDDDPTYASGYAGLADCYNILGYYNLLAPLDAYPKGNAAALKALELDSSLAEAHAALAVVKRDFEWDWSGAEAEFQRAIDLNPGYVEAHHWRSTLLSMLGRHKEGLEAKKRALAMDPLSVVIHTDLARMLYLARNYDEALHQYRAALDLDPNFAFAHFWLAQVYQQRGAFEQSITSLRDGLRLSGETSLALLRLAHGYAMSGNFDQARIVLKDLTARSSQKYLSPYDVAMVYVAMHENDEAFMWLDKAFEERSLWLGYLNVEPQLDGLRSDARFAELARRVGLP